MDKNFLHKNIFCLLAITFLFTSVLVAGDINLQITQFEVNELPNFSLYVSITDRTGQPLALADNILKKELGAIRIYEDGNEVPLIDITPVLDIEESEVGRFEIVLLLDNSESILGVADKVKEAADQFINQLRFVDRVGIVMFDRFRQPYRARTVQYFTNLKSVLTEKTYIDPAFATRRTYLYDALLISCITLKNELSLGKKVLVVLSDGRDVGSKARLKDVITLANREGIPIYCIDFSRGEKNRSLKKLSKETNGKYFYARNIKKVAEVYQAILKQLQGMYRITYRSLNENWATPERVLKVGIEMDNQVYMTQRTYYPDISKLKYLALRYKEATTKVDSSDYIDYLDQFPTSEYSNDIRFRLGVYYEQRGMYDKALNVYDELESQSDQSWLDDVYFRKGKIYESTGKFAEAIQMYSRLVENFPKEKTTPEALLGMARSYREMNDLAKSEQIYNQIRESYAASEVTDEALFELSNLKAQQNRLDEAKETLLELVTKYKESNTAAEAYMALADIAEKQGDLTEAISYCDQALQLPEQETFLARALTRKGDLLFKNRDYDQAVAAYEVVVSKYTDHSYMDEAYLGLAQSYREKNDYLAMRENFDKIKMMKVNNQEVSFELDEIDSVTDVIPPNQAKRVTTLSGAALETEAGKTITFPVQVKIKPIPTPEQFKNFAIAGKIYDFKANVDTFFAPVKISLPYDQSWIDTSDHKLEDFKIYSYDGTKWSLVPNCQVDSSMHLVCAEINHLSWKTIMFQAPRVIRFDDILFAFNSAEINQSYRSKLDTVVQILLESPGIRLEIQGHTDSIGTEEINLELSQKRADVIREFILEAGIDSSRVMARGFGEQFPIASNSTEEGRSLNRRTEFVIVSKGENDIIDVQQRQLGTKYTIELGDGYRFLAQATEQSEVLKKEGFNVSVVPDQSEEGTIYRLFCGYFETMQEAEQFGKKISQQFLQLSYKIVEKK